MNGHKKGIKNFPQTFFTALSGLPLGLPPEPPLESPLRLSLGLLLEAVAKCIGHTISYTDIAVIRTGYRISRLFCDSPLPDDRRSQNGDTSEQKWGYSRTGGIARQDPIPCGICFWAYEDLAQRLAHHLRDRDPARCLARCRMEKGKEKKK